MSVFSERLKWARERMGYTQKEMGEKLGMSGPSYSKYEYGLREPNIDTLAKLPDLLNESLDFLIGVMDFDSRLADLLAMINSTTQNIALIQGRLMEGVQRTSELEDHLRMETDQAVISDLKMRIDHSVYRIELLKSDLTSLQEVFEQHRSEIISKLQQVPHVKDKTMQFISSLKKE